MSVTSALFTGVSGLLGNAEAINVIGNNLSNVNTIGFKSGRMVFSDMLSVNIANNSQIGRGSQIQAVDTVFSQGSFENSEVVTDLAIQGNCFFALKTPEQPTPLTSQATATLTRAGAFRLDASKFLVNPDGYQVVDTSGNGIQFTDNTAAIQSALTATIDPVTVAAGSMADATAKTVYLDPDTVSANDGGATDSAKKAVEALTAAKTGLVAAQTASAAATLSGYPDAISAAAAAVKSATAAVAAANSLVTLSTTATTNANVAITASEALTAAAANLSANPNDANANTASAANTTAGAALNSAHISLTALDPAFQKIALALDDTPNNAGAAYDLAQVVAALNAYAGLPTTDPAAATAALAAATAANDAVTSLTTASANASQAANEVNAHIATVAADPLLITQANADNTAADTAFSIFTSASGAAFSKISKIDADGLITYVGKYGDTYYYNSTNAIGIPTATATLADIAACQRIAVINPSNPGAMEKLGGSLYKINTFAGVQTSGFSVSDNKINGTTEKFFSNQLESSNVDMAAQFVKMILTQRAYSANSKTITTADEMTQEVLNLKR
ncbi:MAG: flagellar hook-basal body complex protein [Desulfuromonadaceae bacterium]|nr:flagellar hook-basal body complex protein [Desulfuromonadaceae bacterium]MDD2855195.1 flagellar hook-basal body complex protein [Desulfuromonadaceae bacterium]